MPNNKGVMMVEVSKVVRDLKTLQQAFKQAKFYKMLLKVNELGNGDQGKLEEERGADEGDISVQSYR